LVAVATGCWPAISLRSMSLSMAIIAP